VAREGGGVREKLLQFIAYFLLRVFICVLQSLRLETCQYVSGGLAWLCCDVLRVRGKIVEENLTLSFPEMTPEARHDLARAMWRHLFLFVAEVGLAPRKVHETNWREYLRFHRGEELCRVLLDDRPVLLISAHYGNFELGGFFLGILGFPTHAVARTLDNPFVHDFITRFRGVTGQHMIPKRGGYDDIVKVLAAGGTMTFLADQYAGSKGCWVDFFGRQASAHKAIALFALDNDARMVVAYARRMEDKPLCYEMGVHEIFDPRSTRSDLGTIKALTQWYTSGLEKVIRDEPEQYWWLHKRWKDNRPARKKNRQAA
jgi:KDO2-lipid IV(A) lauroyltransferase